MRRLDLSESLDLIALMAQKGHRQARRACARWLQLYLEARSVEIGEAADVAGALAALGGPAHDAALVSLRAMLERATSESEYTVVRF